MGRMLDALKALESRTQEKPVVPAAPPRAAEPIDSSEPNESPRSEGSASASPVETPRLAPLATESILATPLPILTTTSALPKREPKAPALDEPLPIVSPMQQPSTGWIDLPKPA